MLSANAGELSVSGSAKATYNATSGQQTDNGLGISNELSFTASVKWIMVMHGHTAWH